MSDLKIICSSNDGLLLFHSTKDRERIIVSFDEASCFIDLEPEFFERFYREFIPALVNIWNFSKRRDLVLDIISAMQKPQFWDESIFHVTLKLMKFGYHA